MKSCMFLFLVVICLINITFPVTATGATIVDKENVKAVLTDVETKNINFQVGNGSYEIPVENISNISLAEDGKMLILEMVSGNELIGISSSRLEGRWELGRYSIALSDIKSAHFDKVVQPQAKLMINQPDGFVANFTDKAGATIEVYGLNYNFGHSATLGNCIGYCLYWDDNNPRKYLPFEYKEVAVGIPFTDIDKIISKDNIFDITLKNGSLLTGELVNLGGGYQRFEGKTDFGSFSLPIDKVRQIIFNHELDKNALREGPENADISGDLNSNYTISFQTWNENQYKLSNGCAIELSNNYYWSNLRTDLSINLGNSSTTIDFDKIKSIQFPERNKSEAMLTTAKDKAIDISLPTLDIWIGGNLKNFGPARIELSKVKSLEINKNT